MNSNRILFKIHGDVSIALMRELIDEFLMPDDYGVNEPSSSGYGKVVEINEAGSSDRDTVKRELYRALCGLTGKEQSWGALTGVRPVKLAGELIEKSGLEYAKKRLKEFYYVSDEKISLITDMYRYQTELFGRADTDSHALYIGIPFCPTRCLYCSFASNQVEQEEIDRYFPVLMKELDFCASELGKDGSYVESCYIGGGTPTTLSEEQLEALLRDVRKSFPDLRELSVEAGRPDTITAGKLSVLKDFDVDRISINPQSMNHDTLERIGRNHTPEEIESAFEIAREFDFSSINCDIIAGLPGEDTDDFVYTLNRVIDLGATNVTVHTLSVKRGSRLHEEDKDYHYRAADTVSDMLKASQDILAEKGFRPYYLYRQKHMAGSGENTGYTKDDKACLYNVRIMDEHQSTLAVGAGGISKKYYPENNRLVRVPNVTNYQEYISRIDEMMERKITDYFGGDKC